MGLQGPQANGFKSKSYPSFSLVWIFLFSSALAHIAGSPLQLLWMTRWVKDLTGVMVYTMQPQNIL
ncbi:hypothetical protein E2C01_013201 [Portunus trituberculatus]|uniref:Uncharacterized protein n=1 Tax=Portunus trituberculatus TaxID=210409 RepID=A0A5B7DGE0_PORTR|nr:hypothetical protein [Portunus trituberculatus]